MKYTHQTYQAVRAELSTFETADGAGEYHVMLHVTDGTLPFQSQLTALLDAYATLRKSLPAGTQPLFERYFLSDAANQAEPLLAATAEISQCALSLVQQPPLDGTKIALWALLQRGVETRLLPNGLFEAKRGNYRQLWLGGSYNRAANSEYQMRLLFNDYALQLMQEGCTLADNCLRTWIFVQNVDCNYAGVVKARNQVFATQNLTEKTHFIASTGIGGRHADPSVLVMLDAYAVEGLRPEQIQQLYARTHLNPTYEYGVSFERGTAIDFDTYRQILISGTASINNKGEVVHAGDIRKQTFRMWENVEALLKEAGSGYEDVTHLIVYLRDVADYQVVRDLFAERFPDIPTVITLAPVCRPGWLIEMECSALKKQEN